MHNNKFLKRFFEIIAGKSLPHKAEDYDDIKFEVTITPEVEGQNPIIIFSGDHSIFPIIIELPLNKFHLELGFTDVCFVEKTAIRNKWWNLVLSKIYISEYHV